MSPTDQHLIEDYIPIKEISAEARREKCVAPPHASNRLAIKTPESLTIARLSREVQRT